MTTGKLVQAKSAQAKSAQAFRTISEVAKELRLPQHVLRFWEGKFSQIRPLKRGGGRRYYRPEDIDLLRGIQHLLHEEGYTIKGAQKLLRQIGAKAVTNIGRGAPLPTPKAPLPVAAKNGPTDALSPTEVASESGDKETQLEFGGLTAAQRKILGLALKDLEQVREDLRDLTPN